MTDPERPTVEAKLASGPGAARRAARLAAVQALYQMALTGVTAKQAIAEFVRHRFVTSAGVDGQDDGSPSPTAEADRLLFAQIVEGVSQRTDDLDAMITSTLAEEWKIERLEVLLLATLRAGAFELFASPSVPAAMIINDYVDVAHAFFAAREPAFVNAALDRLARGLRPEAEEGRRAGTRRAR